VEVIARNARQQARLIEEILDVSRIVSGKLSLTVRDIDWVQLVESAVEAVRPAAEVKGLRLEVVLERLPARGQGDTVRLQQVIANLLSNAVKFSERGRVEVRLGTEEGHALLSVADEGIGMDPGFLPHAFERFRQADGGPGRSQPGLGLGLTIVRHLVELHGGSVSAHSAGPGLGSRMSVRIPLSPPAPARGAASAAADDAAGPPLRHGVHGRRVLVIDNDADSLQLIGTLLRREGGEVALAASAAEARRAIGENAPDAILCDIGMPGEDGLEFVGWLRANAVTARVPLVALTAYAAEGDRERGLAAGFDAYVTKPFDPDDLLRRLADLLAPRLLLHQ
jgi:CheY-like chemotaxis protein